MSTELLFAQFNDLIDAADAVGPLRQFVLDLAVRGRLVAQDPADEPAAELIKRIRSARTLAGISGEAVPLQHGEAPFQLPLGWAWSRVGDVCTKTGSGSTPRGGQAAYQTSGIPFLRSQNVYDDGLRLVDVAYIDPDTHARMAGTHVQPRDLLLNITGGSIGRCCRVPDEFSGANVSQHVAIVRPALPEMADFLHRLVQSPYFQRFIDDEQTGAGRGGLPKGRMDRIAVAIPPLAEQHRIVATVDELMALLDQLEAARARREAARVDLVAASLGRLNALDEDAFPADAEFLINQVGNVSRCLQGISQLRRTVLNLAVRGELTEQHEDAEPATSLLRRVAASQPSGVRQPSAAPDPLRPHEIPDGWCWSSLGEIIVAGPQNGLSPRPSTRPDAPKAITLTATTSGRFDARFFKHVEADVPKGSDLWLKDGDLLFQRGNTREYVGIAAVYRGPDCTFLYPDLMIRVRVSPELSLPYTHLVTLSPPVRDYMANNATGAQLTMPKINQGTLLALPIPVPPREEQDRIVAVVERLMSLCDQLEKSVEDIDHRRSRLLNSLLHQALVSAEPMEAAA